MLPNTNTVTAKSAEATSQSGCSCEKVIMGLSRWRACCLVAGGCLCLMCVQPSTAHTAPAGSTLESPTSAKVQAPRLLQQVKLTYPEAARSSGKHGDVSILVDVDASGRVIATRFESGPEVFRETSLKTASRLSFAPATADGVPVTATTRVSFHFAPPGPIGDGPRAAHTAEMVVHSSNPDLEDTRARTTLNEAALERAAGDDLAETISQVAGVRLAGGVADASKPIIRGQQERRLLVLYDGVRHESQKWGPDHATEIDPFSAGSISVIRGAAGARYGPDAIGGVILVEPPPMRTEPGVVGKVLTAYNTNGSSPYAALRLDSGSDSGLATRIEGNAAMSTALSAPDYILGNTASRVWNLGSTLSYTWDTGEIQASWHHHDFRAGIYYGKTHGTPDALLEALEADRPATADLWTSTYTIDRPYQDVTHDIGIVNADLSGDWGSLDTTYALQLNRRQEYEKVRSNITGSQYDFTLRTHSLDLLYTHPSAATDIGGLDGGLGIQASFQENVYTGLSLIPNFRSFSGGLFAYERLSLDRVDLEAGARVDTLSRAAYMREPDHEAHMRRGTLDEQTCEESGEKFRCAADYTASSFSVGALAHVVPEHLDLKLDLSTATRIPNVDELYMLGSAPTFPVYANGHPDLGTETVWNTSLTAGLRIEAVETEFSGYGQLVEDYIYFSPELDTEGKPRFDVTIRGTYPSFGYQPIDAIFYGADGTVSLGPSFPIGLTAQGGLVRASDRETGKQLVGTPADYLLLSLIGRPPSVGPVNNISLHVSADLVASQSRVGADDDFAPAPEGYTLIGTGIEAEIGERQPIRVGIEAHNILNTRYRDYSSLLRYYADQPGRNIRVRAGMDF